METEQPQTFDFRTHLKDKNTGDIIKEQPYTLHVSKDKGTIYERPIGSGNLYDGAGKLVVKGKDPVIEKSEVEKAKELATSIAAENEKLKAQIAELQKSQPAQNIQPQKQDPAPQPQAAGKSSAEVKQ